MDRTTTWVERHARIDGSIQTEGSLIIDGTIEGTLVSARKDLTIGTQGNVMANVQARRVVVRGTVIGNISARERIEVISSGKVIGDLMAPEVDVAAGADFDGRVGESEPTQAPASTSGAPRKILAVPARGARLVTKDSAE